MISPRAYSWLWAEDGEKSLQYSFRSQTRPVQLTKHSLGLDPGQHSLNPWTILLWILQPNQREINSIRRGFTAGKGISELWTQRRPEMGLQQQLRWGCATQGWCMGGRSFAGTGSCERACQRNRSCRGCYNILVSSLSVFPSSSMKQSHAMPL